MVPYVIKGALGEDCSDLHFAETTGFFSNYMILSTTSGAFDGLWFEEGFERDNLLEVHCTYDLGDEVHAYQNTTHSLGTILFKAASLEEMRYITDHIDEFFRVKVR